MPLDFQSGRTSPVFAIFLEQWTQDILDPQRQQYVVDVMGPLVRGTAGVLPEDDVQIGWKIADWFLRAWGPLWLEGGPVEDVANRVKRIPRVSEVTLAEIGHLYEEAIDLHPMISQEEMPPWKIALARDAVRESAGMAARAAVRNAARMFPPKLEQRDLLRTVLDDVIKSVMALSSQEIMRRAGDIPGKTARSALQPTIDLLVESAYAMIRRVAGVSRSKPEGS